MPQMRNVVTTTTTPMTDAQIKALISQRVADALAERDTDGSRNRNDSHESGGEIKKLEVEIWYLKVKGTDVKSYTQRFQELASLCGRMFPDDSDKDAIEFETELMDQNIRILAKRQAENKRKFKDTSWNNQNQQQPFKRHNVAWAYTAGPGEKKPYEGSKPLCPKCNYHHEEQCAPRCNKCKKVSRLACDC
uniref:Reverse transcriptase domain-containing protein n=1 Tax=Tanacetum cinerariifolium TaxID=118510 RepID=A0A6L2JYI6_TANCI|nr:hypothetical protein [Tanacetum cinerariifolium]